MEYPSQRHLKLGWFALAFACAPSFAADSHVPDHLGTHFLKNQGEACPANPGDVTLFNQIEKSIVAIPETPNQRIDHFCGRFKNDPAAHAECDIACRHTWQRGYQDGHFRMHKWVRDLSDSDGYPDATDAAFKKIPPFDQSILTESPCGNSRKIASQYSQNESVRSAVNGCCYTGYDEGRARLRKILNAPIDSKTMPEIPSALCKEDYEKGVAIGAKLCEFYRGDIERGLCGKTATDELKKFADEPAVLPDFFAGTRLGEGNPTAHSHSACGQLPSYVCSPICYALGLEATMNGRKSSGESTCMAYEIWFKSCKGKQVSYEDGRAKRASQLRDKGESPGAGPDAPNHGHSESGGK